MQGMTGMVLTNRIRWIAGVIGFLLPMLWLLAMIGLFAWLPSFRGSVAALVVVLVLAFSATAVATFGASRRWSVRLVLTAVCWVLLALQVAGILGWAFLSMELGTRQRSFKATADWMKPMESAWCRHSPGKEYSVQVTSEPRRFLCGPGDMVA
jgi:hypothetical protein